MFRDYLGLRGFRVELFMNCSIFGVYPVRVLTIRKVVKHRTMQGPARL